MPVDLASDPPALHRTRRKRTDPLKLDAAKVTELANAGVATKDIAQHQGVNQSTIWRFLERIKPEREALDTFKSQRADVLATLQGKALSVQERIVGRLEADGVLNALTPTQMSSLLFGLNAIIGTNFDKERLERGESTQNISTVSRMVDARVSSLYKQSESKTEESDVVDKSSS